MKTFNLSLNIEVKQMLQGLAELSGKSMSGYVLDLIKDEYYKTDLPAKYWQSRKEELKKQIARGLYSEEIIRSFEEVVGEKLR